MKWCNGFFQNPCIKASVWRAVLNCHKPESVCGRDIFLRQIDREKRPLEMGAVLINKVVCLCITTVMNSKSSGHTKQNLAAECWLWVTFVFCQWWNNLKCVTVLLCLRPEGECVDVSSVLKYLHRKCDVMLYDMQPPSTQEPLKNVS